MLIENQKDHQTPVGTQQGFASDVFLFVRKTTEWQDETTFREQLDPLFAPKVETWNATFRMPYRVFRQRLCEIAIDSHSAAGAKSAFSWDEIPTGAIVLPTDDDDWFAPDIAKRIACNMKHDDEGCLWTQSVLEVPINLMHRLNLAARRLVPAIGPKWLCATNNYAFRKTKDTHRLIGHVGASRAFASGSLRLTQLPERLSIHNRTLASITSMAFMKPRISAAQLKRKAAQYHQLYRNPSLLPGLEWTRDCIMRMADLMKELHAF